MAQYWIGTVSHAHVKIGLEGGFAQLCHGKAQPLKRMSKEDVLIYYSPKTEINSGEPLQMFTALGRVADDRVYQVAMSATFVPYRRNMTYVDAHDAPIKPLIPTLSFIKNKTHWGYIFRTGHFEINHHDFLIIADAMGVRLDV